MKKLSDNTIAFIGVVAILAIIAAVFYLGYIDVNDLPWNPLKWDEAQEERVKATEEAKLKKEEMKRQGESAKALRNTIYEKASTRDGIHGLTFKEMGQFLEGVDMAHIEIDQNDSYIMIVSFSNDPKVYVRKYWEVNAGPYKNTRISYKSYEIPREKIRKYLAEQIP